MKNKYLLKIASAFNLNDLAGNGEPEIPPEREVELAMKRKLEDRKASNQAKMQSAAKVNQQMTTEQAAKINSHYNTLGQHMADSPHMDMNWTSHYGGGEKTHSAHAQAASAHAEAATAHAEAAASHGAATQGGKALAPVAGAAAGGAEHSMAKPGVARKVLDFAGKHKGKLALGAGAVALGAAAFGHGGQEKAAEEERSGKGAVAAGAVGGTLFGSAAGSELSARNFINKFPANSQDSAKDILKKLKEAKKLGASKGAMAGAAMGVLAGTGIHHYLKGNENV